MTSKGTDRRTIRVEPDLWDRSGEAARQLGVDRSTWLRDALRWLAGDPDVPAPSRPAPGQAK